MTSRRSHERQLEVLIAGSLGLAAVTILSIDLFAQSAGWTSKQTSTSPSPRWGHAMAYDAVRGEVVLFGGDDGDKLGDTWVWNGSSWVQRLSATGPAPRSSHAMVFDEARGEVLLFGGATASGFPADTWVWDGVTWTQRHPANSPPHRWNGWYLTYDPARARVLLFGGAAVPDSTNGDTWTWDGANWTQLAPAASPPPRDAHASAYDDLRGEVVVFGGASQANAALADTWTWDGTAWQAKNPATSPVGRWNAAMASDTARGATLLFGGSGAGGSPQFGDTWAWDGANWVALVTPAAPSARLGHAMAEDRSRGQIVLFGGLTGGSQSSETWVWQGTSPVCNAARATPDVLWPPNHKLTQVAIAGVTDPQGDSVTITIDAVTQDEPTNGTGDADTAPDAVVQTSILRLRNERAGYGNGRVYRVLFTASDGHGGSCSGSVSVAVPHSKAPGNPAIDDGQFFIATQP